MIKVKDSTEFDRLLKGLADDIVNSHIHYQLYKDLRQVLSDHPVAAQESNTFWMLTLNAHIKTSTQTLCRVYDQHPSSINLYNWLLTIRENMHLFEKEEFRQRLKDNPFVESLAQTPRKPDQAMLDANIRLCSPEDSLVKMLVVLRNNHGAHRAANIVIYGVNIYDNHPFHFGDFETLLSRALAILNEYHRLFAATTNSTKIVGGDDYRYIFECVEERLMQVEEQIQREEQGTTRKGGDPIA